MAIIKCTNSKGGLGGIIDYITQEEKTEARLIPGQDCVPENAKVEMQTVKQMYGKIGGRQYIHIVQSFSPGEVSHGTGSGILLGGLLVLLFLKL